MTPTPPQDSTKSTWSVSRLRPNPLNPRQILKENGIEELAASIRSQGVLQPLLVTPEGIVVAGHRRLEAARRAGLDVVPVVIRELSVEEQQEVMLVENLQRDDLSPLEEGIAFRRLLESNKYAIADLARRLGYNSQRIQSRLVLTKLDREVQQLFHAGDLPLTLAPILVQVQDTQRQRRLATLALRRRLTVSQLEKMADAGFVQLNAKPRKFWEPPVGDLLDPEKKPTAATVAAPELSANRQKSLDFLRAKNGHAIAFGELADAFERVCCSCGMDDLPDICGQCPLAEFMGFVEAAHG